MVLDGHACCCHYGRAGIILCDFIMKLIVNADDLGRSEAHNTAIIYALKEGICSSATIMVNMPGFKDAVERCIAEGLAGVVGIHLNLSSGPAVTASIKAQSRFCDTAGNFLAKKGHYFMLSSKERAAVYEEIRAQISLCRGSGINPTHADSHNHMHEEPGILSVFIDAVKAEGIPYARITRNTGKQYSWLRFSYRCFANRLIQSAGLRGTEAFGSADDFIYDADRHEVYESFEIMIHPVLSDGVMLDAAKGESLFEVAELWKNIHLVSYADLKQVE